MQLCHDSPTSVKDKVFSPFHKHFIFPKSTSAKFRENFLIYSKTFVLPMLRVGSHVVLAWIHCTDVRIHCTDILIECR